MNQINSGILGNKWLTLSSVESEDFGLTFPGDPILPQDPIRPQDPIDPDPGNPLDPGDPILPGDPIRPQDPIDPGSDYLIGPGNPLDPSIGNPINPGNPIGSDPLTGNPPVNGTPSAVTRLSNPEFRILIDTTRPNEYKVEGKVTVEISEEDMEIFSIFTMRLQSTLWGEDSGPNEEDELFSFPAMRLKLPGTYTFSAYVHRGTLNEDNTMWDKRDEVYNKFSIVSGNRFLQSPGIEIQSRTEHGHFG